MTLMRHSLPASSNFLALDIADAKAENSRVVILTVPFEKTSSFGMGSDAGPEAILRASHEVELFDCITGFETWRRLEGIATLESIQSGEILDLTDRLDREADYWMERDRFVVTIGGEHTSIVGAVRAAARRFSDLTVLQLDAHSDLREDYQGDRWSHACAVRRIMDFHQSIVQAGIRSQTGEEREYSDAVGIPVFYAHEIQEDDYRGRDWIGPIIRACRPNVYLTFDCDAFDPAVIPATGTPEPGGFSWRQVDNLMNRLTQERRLIGFDVSELAPVDGLHHPQFTIAKMIYRILGYVSRNI